MARVAQKKCDICGREIDTIVGKLHYIPSIPGVNKLVHSAYTHHCDVGPCCKDKIFKAFRFQERMTAQQYRTARKNGQMKVKK